MESRGSSNKGLQDDNRARIRKAKISKLSPKNQIQSEVKNAVDMERMGSLDSQIVSCKTNASVEISRKCFTPSSSSEAGYIHGEISLNHSKMINNFDKLEGNVAVLCQDIDNSSERRRLSTSDERNDMKSESRFSDLFKQFDRHSVKKGNFLSNKLKRNNSLSISSLQHTSEKKQRLITYDEELVTAQGRQKDRNYNLCDRDVSISNSSSDRLYQDKLVSKDFSVNLNGSCTSSAINKSTPCSSPNDLSPESKNLAEENLVKSDVDYFKLRVENFNPIKTSNTLSDSFLTDDASRLENYLESFRDRSPKNSDKRKISYREEPTGTNCVHNLNGEIYPLEIHDSVSNDGKEFIRKSAKGLFLAELVLNYASRPYVLTFGNLGNEYLVVANFDKFIGRIELSKSFKLTENFEDDKLAFLKSICITKVLEDELSIKKDEAFNNFIQMLKRRSTNISNDIECAEDFLQILTIMKSNRLSFQKRFMFLKEILQNSTISSEMIEYTKDLLQLEKILFFRNQYFPKFAKDINPSSKDFYAAVQNICEDGIRNHVQCLIQSFSTKNSYLLCDILNIRDFPKDKMLFISKKDIEVFSDIAAIANEESCFVLTPLDFIKCLWDKFYQKVESLNHKSIKETGPLTHPIYPFLLKNIRDIILDISAKVNLEPQKLFLCLDGTFKIKENVPWYKKSAISSSLRKLFQLNLQLMKYFEPGFYSNKNKFKYSPRMLTGNWNIIESVKVLIFGEKNHDLPLLPEDRLVWLYIIDCGTAPLLGYNSSSQFRELSLSIFRGFVKLIQGAKHDRYESFRIASLNIIKYITRLSPYFTSVNSILTDVDHIILDRQMDFINELLNSDEVNTQSGCFYSLMDIYNEYWELRTTVLENLPVPCSIFRIDMEDIQEKLLKLVKKALLKLSEPKLTICFFRSFNEFLKHIQAIDFSWFISKSCYIDEVKKVVNKVDKKNAISYVVKDPERFVKILKKENVEIPNHFLIETVKKLLDIICLAYEKQNWNFDDCLSAVGDLFLTIAHSFTHFEDQADYRDLENFLRDCTTPFSSVVTKSETYADFKNRLDNVEIFFLYARKPNQIGVQRALDLCELEVTKAKESGFITEIHKTELEASYNLYSDKLTSMEHFDISKILDELEKELKIEILPIDQWTPNFKQNILPVILAEVALIWTLLESKDLECANKKIEPHCVQILCILRLLGVDYLDNGVPKHFSQVLTGQGKSLILALLSVVIALTGNKACVVCYSEYLAQRDEEAFESFFQQFDRFNIMNKINYNKFEDLAYFSLAFKLDGLETEFNLIITNIILNKLKPKVLEFDKNESTAFLLIDEADVFFSDKFYGQIYGQNHAIHLPGLPHIQLKLWEIVEGGLYEKNEVLEKVWYFITEILKEKEHEEFQKFLSISSFFFDQQLDEMVSTAIDVSKNKKNNVWFTEVYKINHEGLICMRDDLGIYCTYLCPGYYNVFNYFRLKKENFADKCFRNYGYLLIQGGFISYANLPLRYKHILGVSGTLMDLNESEKKALKSYDIKTMSAMPSFFGDRKLEFKPNEHFTIQDSESNWHLKIFEHISKTIKRNRAVLVFFDTDVELKAFDAKYRSNINRLNVFIGNEESSILEWNVNEAGVSQTVTLAPRAMGRGIDYKSNDRGVEENGGVHVIQTFFSLDEKEEAQIKGRTARKDNKGSYELILCREDLDELECSAMSSGKLVNTYEEICIVRKELAKAKNKIIDENIKKAEEKHNLTMEFLESLTRYKPEKRLEYLSRYPFIQNEKKK